MSNFDRAFIKAYGKNALSEKAPGPRASTREVLLSISLRNQEGNTQRIEVPSSEAQSHGGGPHVEFPVEMSIGQQDVVMPQSGMASSSVFVLPLAHLQSSTDALESHSQESTSDDAARKQAADIESRLEQIRVLEQERADRGRMRREAEFQKEMELREAAVREQAVSSPTTISADEALHGEADYHGVDEAMDGEDREKMAESNQASETTGWEPAWEVDQLSWPNMTLKLLESQLDYFAEAGDQLRTATGDGLNVLAVTSERRGEGRSTLAYCLARSAAAAGVRVAILDADTRSIGLGDSLANQLGLENIPGWNETLDGNMPLSEATVLSLEDGICVMPLTGSGEAKPLSLSHPRISELIRTIASQYDLLILDTAPLDEHAGPLFEIGEGCPVDAAVVVRDVRATEPQDLQHNVRLLKAIGVQAVGAVENFLPAA